MLPEEWMPLTWTQWPLPAGKLDLCNCNFSWGEDCNSAHQWWAKVWCICLQLCIARHCLAALWDTFPYSEVVFKLRDLILIIFEQSQVVQCLGTQKDLSVLSAFSSLLWTDVRHPRMVLSDCNVSWKQSMMLGVMLMGRMSLPSHTLFPWISNFNSADSIQSVYCMRMSHSTFCSVPLSVTNVPISMIYHHLPPSAKSTQLSPSFLLHPTDLSKQPGLFPRKPTQWMELDFQYIYVICRPV